MHILPLFSYFFFFFEFTFGSGFVSYRSNAAFYVMIALAGFPSRSAAFCSASPSRRVYCSDVVTSCSQSPSDHQSKEVGNFKEPAVVRKEIARILYNWVVRFMSREDSDWPGDGRKFCGDVSVGTDEFSVFIGRPWRRNNSSRLAHNFIIINTCWCLFMEIPHPGGRERLISLINAKCCSKVRFFIRN